MDHLVYIALGSNKGDKLNNLRAAAGLINDNAGCKIVNSGFVYETKPYGKTDQENFYNTVILISTDMNPVELLVFLKDVELKAGRTASEKWGPREIDIDIIYFDDLIYSDKKLTVPHADAHNRDFVMQPASDINEDYMHPVLKKKNKELLTGSVNKSIIKKINGKVF